MHAVGPEILRGCIMDHSGTLGHVARPLPDIAAQLAPTLAAWQIHSEAGLRLAGKASESLLGAWYPLSTSPKDCGAKSSTGSDEVASWFSAYRASLSAKQGIAACSPEVGQNEENVKKSISTRCSSHLDEAGEPSGATRDPRGRSRRRPTCPDGDGRLRQDFPAREKG